jgi:mevalonate kinase
MKDQFFYGHGKLLLTSEYFVTEGAQALAIPLKLGQSLHVTYKNSYEPKLTWKSFDVQNNEWFATAFELWRFKIIENETPEAIVLQKILIEARKLNPHFLRDEFDIQVQTKIEFPLEWGLGSSSSLIYNIAEWAYVSPFELCFRTQGGSGYDIACAQSQGPILYQKQTTGPKYSVVQFDPHFKNNLYFLYLNNKQKSAEGLDYFKSLNIPNKSEVINKFNQLTKKFLESIDLNEFIEIMHEHESLMSQNLAMKSVKEEFSDFDGAVKSLGAWGGDFALVASPLSYDEVKDYFAKRNYKTLLKYSDLVKDDKMENSVDLIAKFNTQNRAHVTQ